MRLFVYGTLLDPDLCALAAGRPLAARPAVLRGWRRRRVRGRTYPVILPDARSTVAGAVIDEVDDTALARLIAYEGAGYRLCPVRPRLGNRRGEDVEALVFVPVVRPTVAGAWTEPDWRRRHRRATLATLRRGTLSSAHI
jgi:gamma-glutamylcyclotransferase (GGCT)/AIG2-like uncharacterized protein YtfP